MPVHRPSRVGRQGAEDRVLYCDLALSGQSVCFPDDNEPVYWFHLGMNSLIHCFVPMVEFDSSVSGRGAVVDVCGAFMDGHPE